MSEFILILALIFIILWLVFWVYQKPIPVVTPEVITQNIPFIKPTPSPTPNLKIPPTTKTLPLKLHVFQSFNNCGPAALSMALSYYGINETQQKLGNDLRPYQVPGGDNDDKSVTLDELAEKAKEYDLTAFHRPNGNIELIKYFITFDLPIIVRTWTKENEDIGHYRIIRGYDDINQTLIQDDSLQGKNLIYSYDSFNSIWKKFNFEYLVLVPKNKQYISEAILGENLDLKTSWTKAVQLSKKDLQENPDDIYARFNLSVALYHTGDYQKSVEEFEKVEFKLPFRTLWYQVEPIESYFELENYERVFQITEKVTNNHNLAFTEGYMLRGESYLKLNRKDLAREEFEKAIFYNQNLKEAKQELENL